MYKKFKRIPQLITAVQVNEDNLGDIVKMLIDNNILGIYLNSRTLSVKVNGVKVNVGLGSYIFSEDGSIQVLSEKDFCKLYEEVK